jgi:photosystem II stability/assembly factor-like uncharacterized protein
VQSPCREAGHTREQACVVVVKLVPGDDPMRDETFNLAPARQLAGKVRNFSVIYAYKVRRNTGNSDIGLRLEHGRDTVIADVSSTEPTKFWVTTKDGGRTWSRLASSEGDGALSF